MANRNRVKDTNNIPQLERAMSGILEKTAKVVGEFLVVKLVEKINQQDSTWPPLKAETVARKGSSKIYIDTGELQTLITHIVEEEGLDKKVKVGIFDHDKGLIAHFLEFGTDKGIPERPLFRLVMDMEEEKVIDLINETLSDEIGKFTF